MKTKAELEELIRLGTKARDAVDPESYSYTMHAAVVDRAKRELEELNSTKH